MINSSNTFFSVITENGSCILPETKLWRAKISQAISDSLSQSSRTDLKVAKECARSWFSSNNSDFINVCFLAQLDPNYVLKHVNHALTNPSLYKRRKDTPKIF